MSTAAACFVATILLLTLMTLGVVYSIVRKNPEKERDPMSYCDGCGYYLRFSNGICPECGRRQRFHCCLKCGRRIFYKAREICPFCEYDEQRNKKVVLK
jgi:hypothetical protein